MFKVRSSEDGSSGEFWVELDDELGLKEAPLRIVTETAHHCYLFSLRRGNMDEARQDNILSLFYLIVLDVFFAARGAPILFARGAGSRASAENQSLKRRRR